MKSRRPVFSAANLLAYLEATSLGLVDVGEEERSRAKEVAEQLTKAESRKWRAHRRPSPGRSKPMGRAGLLLLLVPGLFALPKGLAVARANRPVVAATTLSHSSASSRPQAAGGPAAEGLSSGSFALIERLFLGLAPEDEIGGFLRPGGSGHHGTVIGLEHVCPVPDVGSGTLEELLFA